VAVSVENSDQVSPTLLRAREKGIKVLTWDADGAPEARDFSIVHATPESVAHALSFEVGRILGGRGQVAAITSTLDSPNQRAWIAEFRSRLGRDYPDVKLGEVRTCGDDADVAREQVLELLQTVPDLGVVVGFCSPAVPAAADAIEKAGRKDVRVTGVSLPSLCRRYIEEGAVDSVVIWQTRDLGYLAALSAHALATGGLEPGATSLRAGRLGTVVILGDQIRLGRCHIVTRGNLADFA
jgi:rhamnose transport system permease protein